MVPTSSLKSKIQATQRSHKEWTKSAKHIRTTRSRACIVNGPKANNVDYWDTKRTSSIRYLALIEWIVWYAMQFQLVDQSERRQLYLDELAARCPRYWRPRTTDGLYPSLISNILMAFFVWVDLSHKTFLCSGTDTVLAVFYSGWW